MTSTFHGLQTAYKGLMAQQSALRTTGHNIANANTEGYTRQRVNFNASQAYPAPGKNAPSIPGQVGTGVEAESIQRIREHFLDAQYREENMNAGYWDKKLETLERMEDIMNEQSESGQLAEVMDELWGSLQDLSANADDPSAREVTVQRAAALADTYNHMIHSLETAQSGWGEEIDTTVDVVNGLLRQVDALNQDIAGIEARGQVPNDLYDQRDRIVDELSESVKIEVVQEDPGANAHAIAEGRVTIYALDEEGNRLGGEDGIAIVQGGDEGQGHLELSVERDDDEGRVTELTFGEGIDILGEHSGKLGALVDTYGDGEGNGSYPHVLNRLQAMMDGFMTEFNEIHNEGMDLYGESGLNFFLADDEGEMSVNPAIMNDTDLIAAAQSENAGDGSNALDLANVKDTSGMEAEYQSIIGEMAVNVNEARRMDETSEIRRDTIEMNRQSVSSVSLDEEMTNMIQFQHAYNAASRQITVIDEMLDRVINQMGIVGR
ncbi:flagellar hook-associated protein FlgK [Natribacillus halophilus]|uniref:Flagellar hook-associated protein 1 n=1 Tax=Natribacillus halophilus TaxID=549003 RepID=A0A1G8KNS0_9BACI|nr:flagellar hook-associated protein FlgK [Natribacillus halophilus]SDI45058.1 flagellar hook-associated protein 1 FlgK [Natribacillus halophilus]